MNHIHLLRCIEVEMVCLALHRSYTTMLLEVNILRSSSLSSYNDITYSEEKPLQLLAVALWVCNGIIRKLVLLVELLSKVYENGRGLENVETVMSNGWDTSVWVDL